MRYTYTVVVASDPVELVEKVHVFTDQGWEPIGGVSHTIVNPVPFIGEAKDVWSQAMVFKPTQEITIRPIEIKPPKEI